MAALVLVNPGRLAAAGMESWVQRYSNGVDSTNYAGSVATDGSGNVIIAGCTDERRTGPNLLVIKYSPAGAPLWTNRYNGPGNAEDAAQAVALDGTGNVFVTGHSCSSNTISSWDYATLAYSPGGVPLWTNRYNGPGNDCDSATGIAVDTGGNVSITGYSWSGTAYDFATIKYSGAGVPLWTNRYSSPSGRDAYARAICVDAGGNVFVSGYSFNDAQYDCDFVTIKYSSAGTPLWTNRYDGPGMLTDEVLAMALDSMGNAFVTGYSYNGSNYDYVTIKYSSAGVGLWTNSYDGPGTNYDAATAIAVDGNGNAFVTGYSWSGAAYDFATLKYSSAGVALWTNRFRGPGTAANQPRGIAVDGNGNVFVTGISPGSGSSSDYVTIKYANAGLPLWTNRYNGPGNGIDEAHGLAVSSSGSIAITGASTGTNSSRDCATILYSNSGAPLWTNRFNGAGNRDDCAFAIAVDANTNVFITGYSFGYGSGNDYATIKYSISGVPLWTNRYNGPGNSDDNAFAMAVDGAGNVFVTGTSYGNNGINADYATVGYANGGAPLWTNRYNGPGNGNDFARAIAVDVAGNVLVSGFSTGAGTGYDFATLKYSPAGVPLWTNRYNGPGNRDDYALSLAVDGLGNAFVAGYSFNGSNYDYLTIKYSTDGTPLWTNRYDGSGQGDDYLAAIALDIFGNVLVTGYSWSGTTYDFATVKYSSAGAALWTNRYNSPATNFAAANAITTDAAGNCFVTGYAYGFSSSADYATVAYSSAGTLLWTNCYNGPGNGYDEARAVAVDASGIVYVSGFSENGTSYDFATVSYGPGGAPLWTNRYNGSADGDDLPLTANSLALAPDGTVLVAGESDGNFSPETTYDYALMRYIPVPAILTPPASRTNTIGSSATFTVTATGYGPLSYQWQKNGAPIAGRTTSALSLTGIMPWDAGAYTVVVSNVSGAVTSRVATLTVFSITALTRMPDKNFQLTLAGLTNTYTFRIEATTNLAVPASWIALTNITNFSGTFSYRDVKATNYRQRYYRAVWPH